VRFLVAHGPQVDFFVADAHTHLLPHLGELA